MATGSGIAGQLGLVDEVTPGTAVTVTRFYELRSESLTRDQRIIESAGIRSEQRVLRSEDWMQGAYAVSGDIELELSSKNWAYLGKHMLGTRAAPSGAGPYTHVCTPGDKTGDSLTIQVGRPDVSGTVQPFTYAGCKIVGWELTADANSEDPVIVTLNVEGMSETTATALASASYTSSNALLSWVHGSLTIAGGSAPVRAITLTGESPMNTERYYLGSATRGQPLENDLHRYSGTATVEFDGLTQYNRFVNGTESALVVAFARGTDSVTFTMNCRYDGVTPNVGDRDILTMEVPFVCVGSSTDASALTMTVVSGEATA